MADDLVQVAALVVDRGGRRVLHGLDFRIAQGSVTGLLGPSGCGKSTLMRSLVGVQRLTAGTVTIAGAEAGSAPLRSKVGYVTQSASVYDDLTVRENLAFFTRVLGAGHDAVDRAIATVDLASHADSVVGRLSGGQRSRASLAVALLHEPDLLVLDEPNAGVDLASQGQIAETIGARIRAGATVLVVLHELGPFEPLLDRVVVLRDGRVSFDGLPADLQPDAHPWPPDHHHDHEAPAGLPGVPGPEPSGPLGGEA